MTPEQEDRLLEDVAVVKRWVERDAPNVVTKDGCAAKQSECQNNMLIAAGAVRGLWVRLFAAALLASGLSIVGALVIWAAKGA
jgi:hypothetical protein